MMTVERFLKLTLPVDVHSYPNDWSDVPYKNEDVKELSSYQIRKLAKAIGATAMELRHEIRKRRCHNCGCTDDDCSQCIEKTGHPCRWVEENLCSACV